MDIFCNYRWYYYCNIRKLFIGVQDSYDVILGHNISVIENQKMAMELMKNNKYITPNDKKSIEETMSKGINIFKSKHFKYINKIRDIKNIKTSIPEPLRICDNFEMKFNWNIMKNQT